MENLQKIDGNRWKPIRNPWNPWIPWKARMEIDGNPWESKDSMEIHGNERIPWISMDSMEIHGNPGKSMEIDGNQCIPGVMEINGNPWKSMEIHRNL